MKNRILSNLICTFLLASATQAQSIKVEKYRLPNGMSVILHEDHAQPIATVNVWFKVGSKDEPDRRSGFAHLFEHLMFMGTKRVPNGQFDSLMEKFGGNNNASTTEDRTNYFSTGASSILPTLLWLEADRLEGLALEMDQKKLDLQRNVVKNERREGVENAPYGRAFDAINGLMFPKGHPYHTTVIGSMEDLDNATVQDVKDFFNTYYVPNNLSLVVAGDFDSKAIKPLIAKLFGSLPRGNDIVRRSTPAIGFNGVKRITMVDSVQAGKVVMVWHSPATFKPGDIEMRLTGGLFSGGYTSRLYQALVIEKQLASDVSAYQSPLLLGSLFTIDATAREGVSLDKLEKAIDIATRKFLAEGPTKAELDRQMAQITFQSTNGLQSVFDRADRLNEFEFYFGNPDSFARVQSLFRAASLASVKSVANQVLRMDRRLILRVIPQVPVGTVNPRDTQPLVGKDKPYAFPNPVQFKLSNGIPVYYWPKPELGLMTLAMRINRGAAADPPEKSGLAALTADMLDEGAGKLGADGFSDALDLLGAQFSAGADQRGTSVSLTCLTDKFPAAMQLMSDAVQKPQMQADAWKRVQGLHLESLALDDDDPANFAAKVADRIFFGANHPYGRNVSGDAKTVTKLTLNDIKSSYQQTFQAQRVAIFASGNLAPDKLKVQLEKSFGKWKRGQPESSSSLTNPKYGSEKQRVIVVDKPGAVQTVIRIMMPTDAFSSENRFGLTGLGVVFGGSFTSRINRNLREDKGYTYGAGLRFAFSPNVSYIASSCSVRADVTGASLREFISEFAKISLGDITQEEADKARNTIRTEFINSLETRQGLVATATRYAENGIPFAAVEKEQSRFSDVTLEEINRLAKTGFLFDRAVIVLVGDRQEITKQISGLGLAEPEIIKP